MRRDEQRRDFAAAPLPYRRSRYLPLYLSYLGGDTRAIGPNKHSFGGRSAHVRCSPRIPQCDDALRAERRPRGAHGGPRRELLRSRDGEVVSLIGPSGCGKSTLLNIGSGLTAPSEGAAFVDGERVEGPNAQVAFMLQKDLLLPWRTVAENVMFGVEIQGVPRAGAQAARAKAAGKFQPRRIFRSLSAPIVGRHAPARGAGAHACRRSACAAARRAVLGGRRADPDGAAARPRADAQARRARPRCSSPTISWKR